MNIVVCIIMCDRDLDIQDNLSIHSECREEEENWKEMFFYPGG